MAPHGVVPRPRGEGRWAPGCECPALVTSSSSQGTAVEASGGDVTGVAEGKEGETGGEATADTSVSGDKWWQTKK